MLYRQCIRRGLMTRNSEVTIAPMTHTPPLSEAELNELQDLLDALPAPLEPLDVTMLDGYLCGVLLQPQAVPQAQWFKHVMDVDGREAPASPALERLRALAGRRHAELDHAIAARHWFDPWV